MNSEKGAGKFTFHFDDKGNRIGESIAFDEDRKHVIPLNPDEYSVDEDWMLNASDQAEFAPWRSAFEPETEGDRVERMIRETDAKEPRGKKIIRQEPLSVEEEKKIRPSAHGAMLNDQEDDLRKAEDAEWSWRDDPHLVLDSLQRSYRKHPPTHWWKAALSVTAAIVTGAALGLFVLNMLQQDETEQGGGANEPTISVTKVSGTDSPAVQAGDKLAVEGAAASSGKTTVLNGSSIDARTYAFLQNGVFNTSAASDTAVSGLRGQGLAAAVESGDRKTVYAGFAPSREDAQRLAKLLKDKKVDIYVKTITLPAMDRIKWQGTKPESVADYIRNGDKLVRMMSGVTITHLEEAQPTAFDQATVKAIKDAYQLWTTTASEALKDGGAQAVATVQSMAKAMGEAVAALDSYGKKPAGSLLWEAQSAMMRYVLAQKQLQSLISV